MKKNTLTNKFLRRNQLSALACKQERLEAWFAQGLGQSFLRAEQALLDERLETLFGYHLLQLSASRQADLSSHSKVRHRFAMGPVAGGNIVALTQEQALPIESHSVDVVVAHHAIDYSQDPHDLLREISRIILPSGHVVIIGFNPMSVFLVNMLSAKVSAKPQWQTQLLSASRISDWLALLGFSIQSIDYGHYLPACGSAGLNRVLSTIERTFAARQLPLGGFYMIVAKKETSTLTSIKHKRSTAARAASLAGAKPSAIRQDKNTSDQQ